MCSGCPGALRKRFRMTLLIDAGRQDKIPENVWGEGDEGVEIRKL